MNGILAFNLEKLNDVTATLSKFSDEYKESITALDIEITRLEKVWGSTNSAMYTAFKEKYDEKKGKLIEVETMIGELSERLSAKREELEEATRTTINNFE